VKDHKLRKFHIGVTVLGPLKFKFKYFVQEKLHEDFIVTICNNINKCFENINALTSVVMQISFCCNP
jgi:hypothetical protein